MQPLPGPLLPEDLLAEAVELLERLAAESSPSDEPQALRRMAALLATELGARGLSVAIHDEPDEHGAALPVVVATSPAADGAKAGLPILLIGHFDTVLAAARSLARGSCWKASSSVRSRSRSLARRWFSSNCAESWARSLR